MQSFHAKDLPPENDLKKIEALACSISDPVQKLRFIQRAIDQYHEKSRLRRAAARLHSSGYLAGVGLFLILLCGAVMLVFPFKGIPGNHPQTFKEPQIFHAVPYPEPARAEKNPSSPRLDQEDREQFFPPETPKYLDKLIWMVEKTDDAEFYSNRLEINTKHTIENVPRGYYLFPRGEEAFLQQGVFTGQINGILYHASESDVFAYRPEMTQSIKEYSRLLIRYLNKKKAYHYFIDRFGKVYRLIQEDHAAFHSGNSIWVDDRFLYLDLNHAFIGICFEGKDFETMDPSRIQSNGENQPAIVPMERSSINEAQLISGKELTDWLRVKYKIPQHNCIPHGLASVNPYDQLIGHHLDLSHGFPFGFFEISNKYEEPIPAITEFGFTYDNYFMEIFQGKLWPGIAMSEKIILMRAGEKQMSVADYRKLLNERFKKVFLWMRDKNAKDKQDRAGLDQDRS
ncbi:MAG: peptidoglycan recognition family protein [Pseudomonadota bacterium]